MVLANGNILCSQLSDYASGDADHNYLFTVNTSPNPTSYNPYPGGRQSYGGTVGYVPNVLLPYVGNRTAFCCGGGYYSGQTSTCGPSLIIFDPNNPSDTQVVVVHPNFAYNGPDLTLIQQRPNTINQALWSGLSGNYWGADHVRASTLTDYGLAVWVEMGQNTANYSQQNECLCSPDGSAQIYFGCIPIQDIIDAITSFPGTGKTHVPSWEKWNTSPSGGFCGGGLGYDGYPSSGVWGAYWDTVAKQLHVTIVSVYTNALYGTLPIIAIYDITPV
jgi:hypothetical protein